MLKGEKKRGKRGKRREGGGSLDEGKGAKGPEDGEKRIRA
jgi:hypothetical protein